MKEISKLYIFSQIFCFFSTLGEKIMQNLKKTYFGKIDMNLWFFHSLINKLKYIYK